LLFTGLSTSVDSVRATFTSNDGTLIAESRVKRASKTYMSLDNTPHNTTGIPRVEIVSASGEILYLATKELAYNARGDNNIDLRIMTPDGAMEIFIDLRVAGVTMGAFDFSAFESAAATESGELIVTEILWNASNDNDIELHNPTNSARFFDTLITDIDGTVRRFTDIEIAAKGFLVIGRQPSEYADIYTTTTSGLPITTTGNGITITRKDDTVIDRVICTGSNSTLGWPSVSGKRSIELMKDKYNAAQTPYGTPGRSAEF